VGGNTGRVSRSTSRHTPTRLLSSSRWSASGTRSFTKAPRPTLGITQQLRA
jgi:hypothetical protein